MKLEESEGQLLASIVEAERNDFATDRKSLDASGERYWIYKEDWSDAYESLISKGLIVAIDHQGYALTEEGRPLADAFYAERPDLYWYYYQIFYSAAQNSQAHTKLCERVFGHDLTQEGMTDMAGLHHLLQLLDVRAGQRVIDLGCGAGGIAEYIADSTGALVTGLDYSKLAIEEARARTSHKTDHLSFTVGDLNVLHFPAQSFDTAISIDSLYWVEDLTVTMSKIAELIKPGGQIGVFMLDGATNGKSAKEFCAVDTSLGKSLKELGLSYRAYDFTIQNAAFWHRNYQAAHDLKDEFETEGNGFISAALIRESEADFLPFIEDGTQVRYLFHIKV